MGFLIDSELIRAPEQDNPCFRSLFSDRVIYLLTKRYAEPYVSAQMRPLVHYYARLWKPYLIEFMTTLGPEQTGAAAVH